MKIFRNSTPVGRASRFLLMSSFILLLVIFGFVIRSDEIKASAQLSVNAFWSIRLYDEEGYLVPNDLSRHVIGSSDR